jgi:AraC-like DNA-binding protein
MRKIKEKAILIILISALSLYAKASIALCISGNVFTTESAKILSNKAISTNLFFWMTLSYIFLLIVIIFLITIIFISWRKKDKLNERILHSTRVVYNLREPLALIKSPLEEIIKDENLNEAQKSKLNVAIWSANSLQNSINLLIEEEKTDNFFQSFLNTSAKKQVNSRKDIESEFIIKKYQNSLSDISKAELLPYKKALADQLFMEKITTILKTNIESPNFTIDTLCQKIGMSRSSLYNRIKNITGMAPNDFIRQYRLGYAKDLLSSHQYTISEIAYKTGFSDAKYFSAVFKKQYKTTPGAFSKL